MANVSTQMRFIGDMCIYSDYVYNIWIVLFFYLHKIVKDIIRCGKCEYRNEIYLYVYHQRTNNVMESYNREFNSLFDSPNPGLFVFCERVKDEALRWESRHKDSLLGRYTHRQKRKDVKWPEIPKEFNEWVPKKKTKRTKKVWLALLWWIWGERHVVFGVFMYIIFYIWWWIVYSIVKVLHLIKMILNFSWFCYLVCLQVIRQGVWNRQVGIYAPVGETSCLLRILCI